MGEPETVIRAENVGKSYVLRHQAGPYQTIRESVGGIGRSLKRRLSGRAGPPAEEFWALRGVSFEVKRGEVVGVIGRNGAGKSTLLKILSRITEPTTGRIELDGRVASLLEVGTGFHPELTGRENIFMNGAILGMTRAEIKRKFDDIVAFAEVEKFLDTPVKRYSSGMYMRLAFAVAAHLEPEILIVDEVLAVGDAEFQKKCIGKMGEVARGGRTVLFVSHNLSMVRQLCSTGLYLAAGEVAYRADIEKTIGEYVGRAGHRAALRPTSADRPAVQEIYIDSAGLEADDLVVRVTYTAPAPFAAVVGVVLYSAVGQPLIGSNRLTHPPAEPLRPAADGVATLTIRNIPLYSGSYRLSVWLGDESGQTFEYHPDAITFDHVSRHTLPRGYSTEVVGPVWLPAEWQYSDRPAAVS